MKMAKPDKEEQQAVWTFLQFVEGVVETGVYPDDTPAEEDSEILERLFEEWEKVSACWQRVLMAGEVAITNACDPNADTLEWKPEIREREEEVLALRRLNESLANRLAAASEVIALNARKGGWSREEVEWVVGRLNTNG